MGIFKKLKDYIFFKMAFGYRRVSLDFFFFEILLLSINLFLRNRGVYIFFKMSFGYRRVGLDIYIYIYIFETFVIELNCF